MKDKYKFLESSLICPRCKSNLDFKQDKCSSCNLKFIKDKLSFIFLNQQLTYVDERKTKQSTNPYSQKTLKLINENRDKYILDFGAGNPSKEETFDNVIRQDYVRYDSTDITSSDKYLPFKDETFDFVISESVFEHVNDPFTYAKEIFRVLKKEGLIIIDTAFLQPVHGSPHHYFDMTIFGLREIFKDFQEIEAGVESYQNSAMTLNILTKTFHSLISDSQKQKEFGERFLTDFNAYNEFIPKDKQHIMSAGVYFVGKK